MGGIMYGGKAGIGQALMNMGQMYQRKWAEEDLLRMRQEGEEQKELRLLEARTQAGIMSHRVNAQATADVAETAAQRNRERVAGYGGDVDAAVAAGDIPIAEGLKKLGDTSLEEYHKAAAGDIAKRGDYYSAMADSIREGRGRNGTGKDGLNQAKFDAAQIKAARESYKSAFDITDDLGNKMHDTDGQLMFNKRFDGMVKAGRDPQEAADRAMEIVQTIRARAKEAGVPFGKAADEYEAALTKARQGGRTEAPAQAPAPQPQSPAGDKVMAGETFNEAGYRNVESTIDGAERGDARAKALLQRMLEEGGLTAQQRARIGRL